MATEGGAGLVGVDARLVGEEVLVDGEGDLDGAVLHDLGLGGGNVGDLEGGVEEAAVLEEVGAVAVAGVLAGNVVALTGARGAGAVDLRQGEEQRKKE